MKNKLLLIVSICFALVLFFSTVDLVQANEAPESRAYMTGLSFNSNSKCSIIDVDEDEELMVDDDDIYHYTFKDAGKKVYTVDITRTQTYYIKPVYSDGATCKVDGNEYTESIPATMVPANTGWNTIEITSQDGTVTNTYYILHSSTKIPALNYWNFIPKPEEVTVEDKALLEVIQAEYAKREDKDESITKQIEDDLDRIVELDKAEADKAAADEFANLVAALKGDGTDSDEAIKAAKEAYEALSPEAKELAKADNDKLVAAEKAVADKKAEEAAKPTETSTPKATTPAVKKGTAFKVGKNYYKVTKVTKKTGTATFTKASSKKLTAVSIPAIVKYKGYTFKVTVIQKNALKGYKKLKTVTVGKNVTSIGASAFAGDAKLKKITVKSAVLKKVGAKALKGIHKKAVIKVPKKQLKKYTKLFKGKGQKKTVKVK